MAYTTVIRRFRTNRVWFPVATESSRACCAGVVYKYIQTYLYGRKFCLASSSLPGRNVKQRQIRHVIIHY